MALDRKVFVHLSDTWRSVTLCRKVLRICDTVFSRGFALTYPAVIIEPRIKSTSTTCWLRYRRKTIKYVNNGVVALGQIMKRRSWHRTGSTLGRRIKKFQHRSHATSAVITSYRLMVTIRRQMPTWWDDGRRCRRRQPRPPDERGRTLWRHTAEVMRWLIDVLQQVERCQRVSELLTWSGRSRRIFYILLVRTTSKTGVVRCSRMFVSSVNNCGETACDPVE